jgi:tRNA (cytidine/uridine-2'-O-)-methyltransferase
MSTINLVLFEPEIPQNTGNIMRTCLATKVKLHLIEPLGFSLDSKHLNRSSANQICEYFVYHDFFDFLSKNQGELVFLTRYGLKNFYQKKFEPETDYYLVLGKESTGVPKEILKDHLDNCYRLPMTNKVRSLNLSNTAAIVIYELRRQIGFDDLSLFEPENFKGRNFLLK